MQVIVGLLLVMGLVFGGYTLAGGKISLIIGALPFEMMMIGGGAVGAYVMANKSVVLKGSTGGLSKAFKGSKWKKQDFTDVLCLMFMLCKLMKSKGLIAIEPHIEKPDESAIFSQYPKLSGDHFLTDDLICDTLRTMTMGLEDPHQNEDIIERKLEKHHHEAAYVPHALQGMADGLPAIGIVAAVLGVIKTMASISEPPEVLGHMIGGALVGTFLGVFLAYCLVGPLAAKIQHSIDDDHKMYVIVRDILLAHMKGMAPQVSVEIGRGLIPTYYQPSFAEMEEIINNVKVEG
jgi:chemotaxis protein MotA